MEWTLVIYETATGRRPFSEWLLALSDAKARGRIRARLNRVRLGKRQHQIVVLLCGGDKRGQSDDIQQAKVYWKEHKHA